MISREDSIGAESWMKLGGGEECEADQEEPGRGSC